jgi:hypothetical protein
MKRIAAIFVFMFSCILAFGQNSEVLGMLKEIEGKWSLDENGNVTYQRIVEVTGMNKDAIYERAVNYFIYKYGSGKSVIQTQDKEKGLIIGKGLFGDLYSGMYVLSTLKVETWHILRVDIKDEKVRITLTLTDYDKTFIGDGTSHSSSNRIIEDYPVNPKGTMKNNMGKAFCKSHVRAIVCLDAVEKAIKEGTTSKEIEKADW